MPGVITPSYRGGFYSPARGGIPKYPQLWRGCVGAWNPGLGPTGLTLRDWSRRGNHGTLINMTAASSWVVSERHSLQFVSGSNQSVQVPDTGSNLSVPSTSFSISAWCRPTLAGSNVGREIVAKYYGSSSPYVSYGLQFHNIAVNSRFSFAIGGTTGGDNGYNFLEAASASPLNVWYHVCGTYDGNTMRIFVDGLLSNSFAIATSVIFTTQPLTIGRWLGNNTSTEQFDGQIDDVRLYSRVLGSAEIRILASRRGIAYEMAPRRWSASQIAAYRARYYSQVIGSGVI